MCSKRFWFLVDRCEHAYVVHEQVRLKLRLRCPVCHEVHPHEGALRKHCFSAHQALLGEGVGGLGGRRPSATSSPMFATSVGA